jgi:DnaJ-class molecular chaperone
LINYYFFPTLPVLNRIYSTLSDPRQRAIYDANGAKAAEEWNNDGWNPEPVATVYPAISTVLKNAGQQQMYEKMVNMKEAGGTPSRCFSKIIILSMNYYLSLWEGGKSNDLSKN